MTDVAFLTVSFSFGSGAWLVVVAFVAVFFVLVLLPFFSLPVERVKYV